MGIDKTVREYLGLKYSLVGLKIIAQGKEVDPKKKPAKKLRFCEYLKQAALGKSFEYSIEDEACPEAEVALGFRDPIFVEIEPRIKPAQTKLLQLAPLDEVKEPDVVYAVLTPRQAMGIAALLGGLEVKFAGSTACGEVTVKPYLEKKPNITFLCGGARTFADYKDSEVILGAPLETFKKLAERIESLSKGGGALCGCSTSDLPPWIIESFQKLGFEKASDYFFGKVDGENVRLYLNKDFRGDIKFLTIYLPMKREVKAKEPFTVRKRGEWSDVIVTLGMDSIDLSTGKGLLETVRDVIGKVKAG